MPIKVQWGPEGPFAVCDTPTEAMELLRQGNLAQAPVTGAGNKLPKPADPHGSPDKASVVLRSINDNGRQLLRTLAAYPDGIEARELAKSANLPVTALGGILGSLSKFAKKSGLDMERFVISEARIEGQERSRWFTPTKLLIESKDRLQ